MEVHGINSYGEDPFISNGKRFCLKYPPKKSVSIDIFAWEENIPNSRTNGGVI